MKDENPLEILKRARDEFLSYYNTQFYLNKHVLRQEINELLDREGVIWKSPQIELLSNYQPSNSSNLEILKKVDSVQMELILLTILCFLILRINRILACTNIKQSHFMKRL